MVKIRNEKSSILVDDNNPNEPIDDWDRENPCMDVRTYYPNMQEFRLAVKQHAIVNEFELETEKSDKNKFRGRCMG